MTQAERIALRVQNKEYFPHGPRLQWVDAYCEAECTRLIWSDEDLERDAPYTYEFEDGSRIEVDGDTWRVKETV